jgi:hypothetical protein
VLTTMELFDAAKLTSAIAAATVLGADMKAGLFTNTPVIGKDMVIADLTEPTYASYVRQLVVMGAAVRDPVTGIASVAASLNWQETGAVTPVVITGVFYTYGAGPLLLGVELFPTPIALNDLLDAFTTVLEFIESNQNPGGTTVIR